MGHWTETVYRENPAVFRPHLEAEVENAADEIDDLLDLLETEHGIAPSTALDVGTGIGRHAVELAERGVDVRGIDISPAYLERARERAADAGVADRVTFAERDMRNLDGQEESFDLVLNAWTTFGYYDEGTNRSILRGMYERVADDGALVMELVNREGVLADFRDSAVPETGERLVAETHEYDPETARMTSERRVFEPVRDDGGEVVDHEYVGDMAYDVRLYAPVELAGLCRRVGFSTVSLYESFAGDDLERESTRLLVVAER